MLLMCFSQVTSIMLCMLLEYKLQRNLSLFACRDHDYELVLKSVFDKRIHQVKINGNLLTEIKYKIAPALKNNINDIEIDRLLNFGVVELQKSIVRGDFSEYIELSVTFMDGDVNNKLKIRASGAMDQARCLTRAIYI